uniref:Alpha/beta hydrolase fold-3 domain-containing protein n=1 Tax=Coturnix japonica TaxID=93934 RepID=A0A8C2SPL2_COTJA
LLLKLLCLAGKMASLGKLWNTTSAQGILSHAWIPLVAPSQPTPFSEQGKILEKMGLCTEITFTRYMRSGKKRGPEPWLCLQDKHFGGVPVRIYLPRVPSAALRPATIFFHGGENCYSSYVSISPCFFLCVRYRLAPEHKYPAAYEDCLNATVQFMRNAELYGVDPARISTLAGRTDLPRLRAQILIYPGLQAVDLDLPSYQQNRGVPLLLRERAAFFALLYLRGDAQYKQDVLKGSHVPPEMREKYKKWVSPDNIPERFKARGYNPPKTHDIKAEVFKNFERTDEPSLCPLLAEDAVIQQLPETFILTCEYDVLRDDGLLYKKRLEDNGVPVTWCHLEDGFHAIISLHDYCGLRFPSGKRGLDRIVQFIKGL